MPSPTVRRDKRVFISAVTRELGSARKIVKKALEDNDYHVVEQDSFPPDFRQLLDKLRSRIESCDAVVHIAGMCYGAEPEHRPEGSSRRSYTQLEYAIARKVGKPVYVFLTSETFPGDPHAPEDKALSRLQAAHRQRLMQSGQDYNPVSDRHELDQKIRSLQLKVEALERELTDVSASTRKLSRRFAMWGALLLMLLLGIGWGISEIRRDIPEHVVEINNQLSEIKAIANRVDSGSFHIDVGVPAQDPAESGVVRDKGRLRPILVEYSLERQQGILHVVPKSTYLDSLSAGDMIATVPWRPHGESFFEWQYPRLSLKCSNSTSSSAFVTEAVIEVVSSKTNLNPILVAEQGFRGRIHLNNGGWGNVLNPRAKLELADSQRNFVTKQVKLNETLVLDFSKLLSESELLEAENKNASRPFRAAILYETELGETQAFNCQGEAYFGPAPRDYSPPSREPYDVFLPAGKEGYETVVPLSQVVPAGGTDNFELRIGTDKSAEFDLRIGFRTTAGELVGSTPVLLTTFVPRTGKVRGSIPDQKRRGLGQTFVFAGTRLTLSNIRYQQEPDQPRKTLVATMAVQNDSPEAMTLRPLAGSEHNSNFLQFADVVMTTKDDGYYKWPEDLKVSGDGSRLMPQESGNIEFRFADSGDQFTQFTISMRLQAKHRMDEVCFDFPTDAIDADPVGR